MSNFKKIQSEIYKQRVANNEIKSAGRKPRILSKNRSTIPISVSNQYLINLGATHSEATDEAVLLEVGKQVFYKSNYELE
jgi:hypothetical protein